MHFLYCFSKLFGMGVLFFGIVNASQVGGAISPLVMLSEQGADLIQQIIPCEPLAVKNKILGGGLRVTLIGFDTSLVVKAIDSVERTEDIFLLKGIRIWCDLLLGDLIYVHCLFAQTWNNAECIEYLLRSPYVTINNNSLQRLLYSARRGDALMAIESKKITHDHALLIFTWYRDYFGPLYRANYFLSNRKNRIFFATVCDWFRNYCSRLELSSLIEEVVIAEPTPPPLIFADNDLPDYCLFQAVYSRRNEYFGLIIGAVLNSSLEKQRACLDYQLIRKSVRLGIIDCIVGVNNYEMLKALCNSFEHDMLSPMINKIDETGITWLMIACKDKGVNESTYLLLNRGLVAESFINSQIPETGNTALHIAVIYENYEMVELLLENILDEQALMVKNVAGKSPIELASNQAIKDLLTARIAPEDFFCDMAAISC